MSRHEESNVGQYLDCMEKVDGESSVSIFSSHSRNMRAQPSIIEGCARRGIAANLPNVYARRSKLGRMSD